MLVGPDFAAIGPAAGFVVVAAAGLAGVLLTVCLGALLASGAPDLPVDLLGFAIPLVLVAAVVPFGVAAFVVEGFIGVGSVATMLGTSTRLDEVGKNEEF